MILTRNQQMALFELIQTKKKIKSTISIFTKDEEIKFDINPEGMFFWNNIDNLKIERIKYIAEGGSIGETRNGII
jgi:hypothetical protein